MLYQSADAYLRAPQKSVLLFGMSGLGKTVLSNILRENGDWFHYSVDYRIGSRYMAEPIGDNLKKLAMEVPLLRELLKLDSVNIEARMKFHNLAPLATYLGKPGDPAKGGIPFDEYFRRQEQHRQAEIRAMQDISYFKYRAKDIYGYPHLITDSSGSLCEVLSDDISTCPLVKALADQALLVWIEGPDSHRDELMRRFRKNPKPMYYQPDFLKRKWAEYLKINGLDPDQVDPDDFIVWGYRELLSDRLPRYQAMAENWGITIQAEEAASVNSADDFNQLIAEKL